MLFPEREIALLVGIQCTRYFVKSIPQTCHYCGKRAGYEDRWTPWHQRQRAYAWLCHFLERHPRCPGRRFAILVRKPAVRGVGLGLPCGPLFGLAGSTEAIMSTSCYARETIFLERRDVADGDRRKFTIDRFSGLGLLRYQNAADQQLEFPDTHRV